MLFGKRKKTEQPVQKGKNVQKKREYVLGSIFPSREVQDQVMKILHDEDK